MHSSSDGYALQLASFNGLYTLLPPASADAFPVWQKQPTAAVAAAAAAAQAGGANKEGPQQRFLYLCEAGHKWYLNCENTPDKTAFWAMEQRARGLRSLAMGADMAWRVFTGEVDGVERMTAMSLTLEPADRSS